VSEVSGAVAAHRGDHIERHLEVLQAADQQGVEVGAVLGHADRERVFELVEHQQEAAALEARCKEVRECPIFGEKVLAGQVPGRETLA
jgi:Icc-related predicted phosphoesterase